MYGLGLEMGNITVVMIKELFRNLNVIMMLLIMLSCCIKMQLLNRSPGSAEEEGITTNKPVDTSVVMKERLPVYKGKMIFSIN